MKVKAFPEVFNTFGSTDIKNSKKAILNNVILETYKNELLLNKDGCIFKLVHNNLAEGLCVEDFIICGDFTGPDGVIYLPNEIYENLLLDETNNDINIELFNPPQASKIRLKSGKPISDVISVRDEIEKEIKKNHMFIRMDDVISVNNNYFIVQELEPYNICLTNNTDIELEIQTNLILRTTKLIIQNMKMIMKELIYNLIILQINIAILLHLLIQKIM